jgi:hypothetical protein
VVASRPYDNSSLAGWVRDGDGSLSLGVWWGWEHHEHHLSGNDGGGDHRLDDGSSHLDRRGLDGILDKLWWLER